MNNNIIIAITGPSGVGKTTLLLHQDIQQQEMKDQMIFLFFIVI